MANPLPSHQARHEKSDFLSVNVIFVVEQRAGVKYWDGDI
jgi:hypothetical protein